MKNASLFVKLIGGCVYENKRYSEIQSLRKGYREEKNVVKRWSTGGGRIYEMSTGAYQLESLSPGPIKAYALKYLCGVFILCSNVKR